MVTETFVTNLFTEILTLALTIIAISIRPAWCILDVQSRYISFPHLPPEDSSRSTYDQGTSPAGRL